MKAIGPTHNLSQEIRKAFEPFSDFDPIPSPGPGDWLSVHPEPGQTFAEYKSSGYAGPDRSRRIIYLQPVGEFADGTGPSLADLKLFAEAFFCLEVEVASPLKLGGKEITSRINTYSGRRQLLTLDILSLICKSRPADAYCIIAITMEDLYPDPSWNFVFGQASILEGVGVFSFSRYDPRFYGETLRPDDKNLLLSRSCKVLAHETAHMFGLLHCIRYHCLMNGSNHIEESDRRPLRLCPVCLRKLYHSTGFDIGKRYVRLLRFYESAGFHKEAGWVKKRISHILD